jgi:hypothetical protein
LSPRTARERKSEIGGRQEAKPKNSNHKIAQEVTAHCPGIGYWKKEKHNSSCRIFCRRKYIRSAAAHIVRHMHSPKRRTIMTRQDYEKRFRLYPDVVTIAEFCAIFYISSHPLLKITLFYYIHTIKSINILLL